MSNDDISFTLPRFIESKVIFEESLVKIRRDKLQIQDRPPYHYYSLITHPFAVAILATTVEGAFILTREYRHATGRILLGCPGGYVDSKEDPLDAARRELLEETGYQADSFNIMGSAFPYAGFTEQKTIYIRAYGATFATTPKLEPSEIIRPYLLKQEDLTQLIQTGLDMDGVLCTALFFYQNSNYS